jgi:uncharacterized protein YdeI (YjbR/CyaY-like superfamily)
MPNVKNVEGALRFASRERWRKWLEKNHATKSEALLVIYKRPPKNERFPSHYAREEALCFGWIDGWFRPIDDERWVMRYSPRRRGSNWSKHNIARAWKLLNEGRMTPATRAKPPRNVTPSGRGGVGFSTTCFANTGWLMKDLWELKFGSCPDHQ